MYTKENIKGMPSVECSDRQLGWGIGNNKLGKLYHDTEHPNVFIWKGMSQGRNLQKINSGIEIIFNFVDDSVIVVNDNGKGWIDLVEVKKAIYKLLKI